MTDDLIQNLQDEIELDEPDLTAQNNEEKTLENLEKNSEKIPEKTPVNEKNAENSHFNDAEITEKNEQETTAEAEHVQDREHSAQDVQEIPGENSSDTTPPLNTLEEDPYLKKAKEQHDKKEAEPKVVKAKDVEQKVLSSPKNRENLKKLGLLTLGRADKYKAALCSFISGQHAAEYMADEEMLQLVIEAIKEYVATMEVEEPSPAMVLLFSVLAWTLPPVGLAFWHKYKLGKPETEKTSTTSTKEAEQQQEEQEEEAPKYSHLKEFKDKRKIFSCTKDGYYNRTPLGTFIKVADANEKPSPQVQQWIDEELSNKEIRKLLNHGG